MKTYLPKSLTAFASAVLLLSWVNTSQAGLIVSHTFTWTDPASGGMVDVTEEVFDNFGGDFSLYEWRYTVDNTSYDPVPGSGLPGSGTSNGLSGFNLVFPQQIPELANQFGPAGWFFNCCGTTPPFGAEWDIDNTAGFGIPIGGSDVFGFTTFPRIDVVVPGSEVGSWMHSWIDNGQSDTFNGDISVPGRRIPEPTTVALLTLGLAGIGYQRRRKAFSS